MAQPANEWTIDTVVAGIARLSSAQGVAADGAGNIYIADTGNHLILKVDAAGNMTRVAGIEKNGFSGDGGPAAEARLNAPRGVAVDGAGNLYIADTDNHRIRKVDTEGIITTVAGSGSSRWGGFSGDSGPAAEARLRDPQDVAVDGAGNLYIADTDNHRIRKVDTEGIITTVAGSGRFSRGGFSGDGGLATEALLYRPQDVAVDDAGNLYIADTRNHRIRKVDTAGIMTTVAGSGALGYCGDGGPATGACLWFPRSVAADGSGNLYIADTSNYRIRRVDAAGIVATVAGRGSSGEEGAGDDGPATAAWLSHPQDVAADGAGNLYIAGGNRVRKVNAAGIITTAAGSRTGVTATGDGGRASEAELNEPRGAAVDGAGNLYIADTNNQRIRRVDIAGIITTAAGVEKRSAFEGVPGGYDGDGFRAAEALLYGPQDVAADGAGNLYIADTRNHRIRRVDAAGIITTIAGTGNWGFRGDGGPAARARLRYPRGVALDGAGNLFIADSGNHRIRKITAATGIIATVAGSDDYGYSGDNGPAVEARLRDPTSVAADGAGNIFIADSGNHRMRKVDSEGIITTIAGTGEEGFSGDGGPAVQGRLDRPRGVTVDKAGNLYIADTDNHRIRRVDAAGIVTTIAGTGRSGFHGDGGPAAEARLNSPQGAAVDGAGNLYVADTGNNRIRRLTPPPPPPAPTAGGLLRPGQPGNFFLGPVDSPTLFNGDDSFRLEVPANASRATITLNSVDPAVDMDLHVRFGEDNRALKDGRIVSDHYSRGVSGNEEVVVTRSSNPPLRAGTWFVSLALYGTGVVSEGTVTAELQVEGEPPPSGPPISSSGIVLATGAPVVNRISPNALIAVFGEDFTPEGEQALSPRQDAAGRVAAELAAVCLEIDGKRAPLFAVFPNQINAQAPHDLAPGQARAAVIRGCGAEDEQRGPAATVEVAAVSPAFFNFPVNSHGRNPVVALHGGGPGLAGAPGAIPGVELTPVEPGEVVTLFGTGFGKTEPPLEAGEIPGAAVRLAGEVSFTFGGIAVPPWDILYAGAAPCCAGLYQFTVRVPPTVPDGAAPVTATVQGVATPEGPFLAIRRQ